MKLIYFNFRNYKNIAIRICFLSISMIMLNYDEVLFVLRILYLFFAKSISQEDSDYYR